MKNFMKRTRLVLAVMTLFAGNMNAGTEEQQIVSSSARPGSPAFGELWTCDYR
jgi:hypothetical protein